MHRGLGAAVLVFALSGTAWMWADDDVKTGPRKGKADAAPTSSPLVAMPNRLKIEQDYQRRLAVCQKLQELAEILGDDDLRRKAFELEERNWKIYRQQSTSTPLASAGRGDKE